MYDLIKEGYNFNRVYTVEVETLGQLRIACDEPETAATLFAELFFTGPQLESGVVVEVDTDPYSVLLANGKLDAEKI